MYHTELFGWLVGWLVGWFYGISTLVGLFNHKVSFFLPAIVLFRINDNIHCQIIIASSNYHYK